MMKKFIVLLVDDDSLQIEILTTFLQASFGNIEFFEANNGKQALEIIKYQSDIDLVVSDIQMPEMDGLEFVEAARLIIPNLPILLITGNMVYTPAEVKACGANDLLYKPFTREMFIQSIRSILSST